MKRLAGMLPVLAYCLVVIVVMGSALFPPEGMMIHGDDIHRSYNFFRRFFVESVKSGEFPWWNPYQFAGAPFIANPSNSFWYPPQMLFFLFSYPRAYSLLIAMHIVLAMGGMYWLGRRVIGLSPSASWFSGIAFGLSGYMSARIWAGHIEILTSAPYIPWVFGLFWLAMTKLSLRYGVLAGIALALQIYAGYQTIALLTLEAVGFALIIIIIHQRSLRPLIIASVGILGAIGLAAVQILPSQEFMNQSIRTIPRPYSWSSYGSMQPEGLLQFISPFYFGDQEAFSGPPPNYHEQAGFIGRVAIILAVLALVGRLSRLPKILRVSSERDRMVVALLAICLFSVWVSLGSNAPIDLQKILWDRVPFYQYLRFPPRHLYLFVFAASCLSGIGLSVIRKKGIQFALLGVLVLEMIPFARHFIVLKEIPEKRHDLNLICTLSPTLPDCQIYSDPGSEMVGKPESGRMLANFGTWVSPRDSLDFDAASTYKFFSTTGYDPSIVRSYYEFADALNGKVGTSILEHDVQIPYLNIDSPYINFLNIKYLLVPSDHDPLGGNSTLRYKLLRESVDRGYRLYENIAVLPRFFFVPTATMYPTEADTSQGIRKGAADLTESVILTTSKGQLLGDVKPDCPGKSIPNARIVSYNANNVVVATEGECGAFLVSSEVYYPGWEAAVDGKKVQIIKGNLSFRTLFIPKGKHTIKYSFRPKIFGVSFLISVATVIIMMFIYKIRQI